MYLVHLDFIQISKEWRHWSFSYHLECSAECFCCAVSHSWGCVSKFLHITRKEKHIIIYKGDKEEYKVCTITRTFEVIIQYWNEAYSNIALLEGKIRGENLHKEKKWHILLKKYFKSPILWCSLSDSGNTFHTIFVLVLPQLMIHTMAWAHF